METADTISHKCWIQTQSGISLDLTDPDPDSIALGDIAFSLSNQCRFNGHSNYYSVASHCCSMAEYAEQVLDDFELARYCLLHDAEEYAFGDVVTPIKNIFPEIRDMMTGLRHVIYRKFGLDPDLEPSMLHDLDIGALKTERMFLFDTVVGDWYPDHQPLDIMVFSESPEFARWRFMSAAMRLFPEYAGTI